MKKPLPMFIAICVLACSPLQAKDEGLYLGGSIGLASVTQKIPGSGGLRFDDDDFAYKVFAGYQFSGLFAVEGAYRDLGTPSYRTLHTDLRAYDVFAVAGLPIGPLRVFAKAGGVYWDSTSRVENEKQRSDNGLDLGVGVGAEFEIWSMALRAEIEYLGALEESLMYSVGATFTF